jgi:transposase
VLRAAPSWAVPRGQAAGSPTSIRTPGRLPSVASIAAAAGIAPVLRFSGALSYRRRARRGNKDLKDVFYRSALYALWYHETSKSFYRRKREEGKGHHQAVLALARRRVNVLWAMLRDGKAYEEQTANAAWQTYQDATLI